VLAEARERQQQAAQHEHRLLCHVLNLHNIMPTMHRCYA
jgi:hypothetical protein